MKVGFIGGGKMAEAIIRGIVRSGEVAAEDVVVSDISAARCGLLHDRYGVTVCAGNRELVDASHVVFLAVKPQGLGPVLDEIASGVTAEHLVISILAGKRLAGMAAVLTSARLVRVMPNLPATVGEGMSVFCVSERVTADDRSLVQGLLESFGRAVELPETQFDAVTAVSGSGPAFFAHFLAQVIKVGEQLGLTPADAELLATQTMLGTAKLLSEQTIRPAELVQAVCSRRGTTEAGMAQLAVPALTDLVHATLTAAASRSCELSA